jgi:hypothetical protein
MPLDGLEAFALHAALGSALWFSALLLYSYAVHPRWVEFALARAKDAPTAVLAGLTAIAILAGLLLDNIADFVDDEEALPWLLTPERNLRADVLFAQQAEMDLWSPEPLAVELAEKGMFRLHAAGSGADLEAAVLANQAFSFDPQRLRGAVSSLYYRARSRVLREPVYAAELSSIHRDISILRSMSLLGLLLGILAPIACCVRKSRLGLPRNARFALELVSTLGVPLLFALLCGCIASEEEKSYNKRTFAFLEALSSASPRD